MPSPWSSRRRRATDRPSSTWPDSGSIPCPRRLVLTFDKALDPASAQDPLNYMITNSRGHSVRIASVVYDPSAFTVTISPAHA